MKYTLITATLLACVTLNAAAFTSGQNAHTVLHSDDSAIVDAEDFRGARQANDQEDWRIDNFEASERMDQGGSGPITSDTNDSEHASHDRNYWIDSSDQRQAGWEDQRADYWMSCEDTAYDNGVVRSWYLRERNRADFRMSKVFCRDMQADGTMDPNDFEGFEHFYYTGNGTTGHSSLALGKLPVGVRIHYKEFTLGPLWIPTEKVIDIDMLSNTADKIVAGSTSFSSAGTALGRNGHTATLTCEPGYVVTAIGLGTTVDEHDGGKRSEEIHGVTLICSKLVAQ